MNASKWKKYPPMVVMMLFISVRSCFSQSLLVNGHLKSGDTLRVILADLFQADTLITSTGRFQMKKKSLGVPMYMEVLDRKTGTGFRKEFFVEQGEVRIGPDTVLHLQYAGLQDKYEEFNRRFAAVESSFNTVIKQRVVEQFIRENLDNTVGAYVFVSYLYNLKDVDKVDSIYRSFTPEIWKRSPLLQLLGKQIKMMRNLVPGKVIPSFTATLTDGRLFHSASLKGKYAVLDFWGTWCKPCIAGFPKMKQYYARYRDSIEFVSIDCRDEKNKWKQVVQDLGLWWTQVRDNESYDLEKQFNANQYPTKILIDPHSRILNVYLGEEDGFYQRLDRLFGQHQ